MKYKNYKHKYGLTRRQYQIKRTEVLFKQSFRCYGCNEKIGIKKGDFHLHHLNENPKDNHLDNLVCVCPLDHWFLHGFENNYETR
jgi:hypothetical protein